MLWKIFGYVCISIYMISLCIYIYGFPGGIEVKNLAPNAGDTGDVGSIPESGRAPGG